jgi:precorrin-2/cobalt-factor-2 C20-methyltransferase
VRLIGVGVGPGDPELLTLKAVRILSSAGRVFVPVLSLDEVGRAEATIAGHVAPERIERLVFALNERYDAARRYAHWDAAGARVAQWLRDNGGTAAFATIGDPNLYSTFGYLAQTVRGLCPDVAVESVPGITAMQALASASGVPLAEGRERLTLLPATAGLDRILESDGTVVVYKGFRHVFELTAAVKAAGRTAVYGERLGLAGERITDLSTVDSKVPYLSTVLIPARRETRGGKL